MACATVPDPQLYFFNVPRFAEEVLGWEPDPRQREALRLHGRRVALNWGRQSGKTTITAVKALHFAFTRGHSTTLVLGGVESHLAEFFTKLDEFVEGAAIPTWSTKGQKGKRISRVFKHNGARIVGMTTSKGVRGHSAGLLILDEAGFIEDKVWNAVLPTLAVTKGTLWAVGTPNGAQGWYHDLWVNGDQQLWSKSEYKASENGRVSAAYLLEMRQLRGETFMRQEFECEFVHDGKTLLHAEDVDALFERKESR